MVITDQFVMLNLPKTGSSFARKALKKVHHYDTLPNKILRKLSLAGSSMIELSHPSLDRQFPEDLRDQHGTYRQIPEEHRHKTVVSVIRNPVDRYVSAYLFGWWKINLHTTEKRLRQAFPHFPELSFREYYEMINLFGRENRLRGMSPRIDLGFYTIQFIQFFSESQKERSASSMMITLSKRDTSTTWLRWCFFTRRISTASYMIFYEAWGTQKGISVSFATQKG